MHTDVVSDTPGKCRKCGMDLVASGSKIINPLDTGLGPLTWHSYIPLIAIIGLIFLTAFLVAFKNYGWGALFINNLIAYFMAGFFLAFSAFKLIDLKGFAAGYSSYDLLAKKVFVYGYLYPFIELFFGLAMIINYHLPWLLWSEFIIMTFSGLGVAIKLLKKEEFQCVCLGTFLKIPLTKVTLVEDFGMAFLALVLLII